MQTLEQFYEFMDELHTVRRAVTTYYLMQAHNPRHVRALRNARSAIDEYYVRRTTHGSTLSRIVHAAVLRYLSEHRSDRWSWFVECLRSDVFDTQGGTTLEGVHCGGMAGSIDIVVSSFAGVSLFRDHVEIEPQLPDDWQYVSFAIRNRGARLRIEVVREDSGSIPWVTRTSSVGRELTVHRHGHTYELPEGERVRISV